jgi:hypothetical protein
MAMPREAAQRGADGAVGAYRLAFGGETLHAEIAGFDDIDIAVRTECDIGRMEQLTLARSGLAELEQQPARALVQYMDLMMGNVGDIQSVAGDGQIHRAELTLDAKGLDVAVIAVIDQHLVAPGIGDVTGSVGVDADVDRALDAAGAVARHETEALLRQIENRQPAGARVGHVELALVQGDAVGLRQPLRRLFLADDEVGKAVLFDGEVTLAGNRGQVLDARRVGQRRVEHRAGGIGRRVLLGLAGIADASGKHRRGDDSDDAARQHVTGFFHDGEHAYLLWQARQILLPDGSTLTRPVPRPPTVKVLCTSWQESHSILPP